MRKQYNWILLAGLSLLALSAPACGKLGPAQAEALPGDGGVDLTVRVGTPATKAASQSEENEKMIRNVQVFVFRSGKSADAGKLEVAVSAGFDKELEVSSGRFDGLTVKCSTGDREVWAVVNDSRDRTAGPDAVSTLEGLLQQTHLLSDSRKDKLLMAGSSGSRTLHEGKEEIGIEVHRLAASVVLESVKNDFLSPAYQKSGVFRVEDCYLVNVPGSVSLGGAQDASALPPEAWLARQAGDKDACEAGLIYDRVEPKTVEFGASDTTPHSFYSYPNACPAAEDAAWNPRATLLVLEASLHDGREWTRYYYPIVLSGGLASNKQYRVQLTVHRPGSTDPNKPVRFDDLTSVIKVSDWDTGEAYHPEI